MTELLGKTKKLLLLGLLFSAPILMELAATDAAGIEKGKGDAEAGKTIFNGKGICFYCHGKDARLDQLPQLSPQTADMIAHLNPKPSNLRNLKSLRLKDDQQRFRIIRDGHLGTGMLPDTNLSDRDIHDLLAYLSELRRE